MNDDYRVSEYLQELMARVIADDNRFNHLRYARIVCLERDKSKKSDSKIIYADCTKVNDKMKAVANCDFIITFYRDGLLLDPEIQYRLMYHELLHVGYDPETGKYWIVPHDLEDFKAVVNKWGVDWIEG